MEKCVVNYVNYEPSHTIEKQGKQKDLEKYINAGYYVQENRNGYWVLIKPSKVIVTISSSSGVFSFNMKHDILDYYSKKRISDKQIDKFKKDVNKEKVIIYMETKNNSYCIKNGANA